jgi:hypothetical protein
VFGDAHSIRYSSVLVVHTGKVSSGLLIIFLIVVVGLPPVLSWNESGMTMGPCVGPCILMVLIIFLFLLNVAQSDRCGIMMTILRR